MINFHGFRKTCSKDVARDRLKLLLTSERLDCSAENMALMKKDLIKVIQKYMDIDDESMEIYHAGSSQFFLKILENLEKNVVVFVKSVMGTVSPVMRRLILKNSCPARVSFPARGSP